MTLVIMAAGMGSRFGGLKQIEPINEYNEFILDYSIYDAIRCGFDKAVFIIKEENYEIFRNTIGKRIENVIDVKYVFQKNDNVPSWVELPSDRTKPLGTAHAILCTKDMVDEPFVIINADDFYGYDAYLKASEFIKKIKDKNEFAMIGYKVKNTMSLKGSVKRGVCEQNNGDLVKIVESSVEKILDDIIATPLDVTKAKFMISPDELVSMNMFVFTPKIYEYLESHFEQFFKDNKDNLKTSEYLIPDLVASLIDEGLVNVKVIETNAKWQGITYKEDKEILVNEIKTLVKEKKYPNRLWS